MRDPCPQLSIQLSRQSSVGLSIPDCQGRHHSRCTPFCPRCPLIPAQRMWFTTLRTERYCRFSDPAQTGHSAKGYMLMLFIELFAPKGVLSEERRRHLGTRLIEVMSGE